LEAAIVAEATDIVHFLLNLKLEHSLTLDVDKLVHLCYYPLIVRTLLDFHTIPSQDYFYNVHFDDPALYNLVSKELERAQKSRIDEEASTQVQRGGILMIGV
jgi:hypothetical protein